MKTIQDFEDALYSLLNRNDYRDLTVRELVGSLEIVKAELLERSRPDLTNPSCVYRDPDSKHNYAAHE